MLHSVRVCHEKSLVTVFFNECAWCRLLWCGGGSISRFFERGCVAYRRRLVRRRLWCCLGFGREP